MSEQWYWCLRHQRVESEPCGAANRMGPYPTREAARNWKDRVDAREDAWDADDERWDGPRSG